MIGADLNRTIRFIQRVIVCDISKRRTKKSFNNIRKFWVLMFPDKTKQRIEVVPEFTLFPKKYSGFTRQFPVKDFVRFTLYNLSSFFAWKIVFNIYFMSVFA